MGHNKINVCKITFIPLHVVSAARLRRICNLKVDCMIPRDKIGLNPKSNAISSDICQQIQEHIESFPVKMTHYGGKTLN